MTGILLGLISRSEAQFVDATPPAFTSIGDDADWGDFDNDGDLDLLIIGYNGSPTTILYENQNGTLIEKATGITGVNAGSCDWGDFDNDGDLDILLSGYMAIISNIYVNNNGIFTRFEPRLNPDGYQLPYMPGGEARWADFNNDGWLDIICVGPGSGGIGTDSPGIFESTGDGNFVRRLYLPNSSGSLDVGDFDNDGDLDFAFGPSVKIYRNDGSWVFTLIADNFITTFGGDVIWTDMDSDGDLDLVVAGEYYSNVTTIDSASIRVYQNNGTMFNALTNSVRIKSVNQYGSAIVGDFNNDGSPDVIVSDDGRRSNETITPSLALLNNNGQGDLTDANLSLPPIGSLVACAADYDQDHNLDFFVRSKLFRNTASVKNTPPNPPSLMVADSVINNMVYLHWNSGSDNETIAEGLSYQIYVGTQSHQQDVVNSNSNLSTGGRKLAELGTAKGKNWKVSLPGGIYYFGVQTIDPAFEGSAFSPEISALVIGIHSVEQNNCIDNNSTFVATPSGSYTWNVTGGAIISGQGSDSVIVRWDMAGYGRIQASNSNSQNTLMVRVEKKPMPVIFGASEACTIGGSQYDYSLTDTLTSTIKWTTIGGSVYSTFNKVAYIDWNVPGKQQVIAQAFSELGACFETDTLFVNVDQRPSLPSVSGQTLTCPYEKDIYVTNSANPVWDVTNGTIKTDSAKAIEVLWAAATGNGIVTVKESSINGYCVTSNSLNVYIKEAPAPIVYPHASVCEGDKIWYTTDAPNPQWEIINGTIDIDSTQEIEVLWMAPGKGSVILTPLSGPGQSCLGSAILPVDILGLPSKPTITLIGDALESSPSPSQVYQWFLNDFPYSQSSVPYLQINHTGSYSVAVFYANCSSKSDEVLVNNIILSVPSVYSGLTVYPNPANNIITLQMTDSAVGELQLSVYSILNKQVMQSTIQKNELALQQQLDITNLSPGLYFLKLTSEEKTFTTKFTKL